jgi:hypothetical protein
MPEGTPDEPSQLADDAAAQQPDQQPPATPNQDSLAGSFGAARGSESAAPNMIGDFSTGPCSFFAIQRQTSFAGTFNTNGVPSLFNATLQGGTIELRSTGPVNVAGIPLPPGTTWLSQSDGFAAVPTAPGSTFALQENPDETAATAAAFPGAQAVQFNQGQATLQPTGGPPQFSIFTDYSIIEDSFVLCLPSPSGAPIVGRVKLSDNNSPMPRDRVFFDYNYFTNVPIAVGGVNVHRFTPGFEKTFFDGLTSFELRVPMASTIDSTILADGSTDLSNGEFGNLTLVTKALLLSQGGFSMSAGLGAALPTADNLQVVTAQGVPLAAIDNDAVHLMPYLASLYTRGRFFTQTFVIVDVGVNGNEVRINNGSTMAFAGRLNDQTLLALDTAVGAWLYRNENRAARVQGLACSFEAHYTSAVQDVDVINTRAISVLNPDNDFDVVNLTVGSHLHVGRTILTTGYSVPVTADRVFDGEARVFLNRYF